MTDGKPMEVVFSKVGEWSDPIRCRVLVISEGGDFSLNLSSSVRVRGRECVCFSPLLDEARPLERDWGGPSREPAWGVRRPASWGESDLEGGKNSSPDNRFPDTVLAEGSGVKALTVISSG